MLIRVFEIALHPRRVEPMQAVRIVHTHLRNVRGVDVVRKVPPLVHFMPEFHEMDLRRGALRTGARVRPPVQICVLVGGPAEGGQDRLETLLEMSF